jgi:hypothetical protein
MDNFNRSRDNRKIYVLYSPRLRSSQENILGIFHKVKNAALTVVTGMAKRTAVIRLRQVGRDIAERTVTTAATDAAFKYTNPALTVLEGVKVHRLP